MFVIVWLIELAAVVVADWPVTSKLSATVHVYLTSVKLLSIVGVTLKGTSLHIVAVWSETTGSGLTVTVTVNGDPSQPEALNGTML